MNKVTCDCCGQTFETDELQNICDLCFFLITTAMKNFETTVTKTVDENGNLKIKIEDIYKPNK